MSGELEKLIVVWGDPHVFEEVLWVEICHSSIFKYTNIRHYTWKSSNRNLEYYEHTLNTQEAKNYVIDGRILKTFLRTQLYSTYLFLNVQNDENARLYVTVGLEIAEYFIQSSDIELLKYCLVTLLQRICL